MRVVLLLGLVVRSQQEMPEECGPSGLSEWLESNPDESTGGLMEFLVSNPGSACMSSCPDNFDGCNEMMEMLESGCASACEEDMSVCLTSLSCEMEDEENGDDDDESEPEMP